MAQTDPQYPASSMPSIAWGALAIRGILAVIFGLVALLWPEVTLLTLVQLFALVGGIFALVFVFAFGQADRSVRWLVRLEGVLGIVLGAATFFWPEAAALTLLYIIAAWAIITGVLQIVAAVGLRRAISGEWALILGGVASVIFGVLLAVWPREGLLALVWIFGIYALVFGITQLVLAYRVRKMPIA